MALLLSRLAGESIVIPRLGGNVAIQLIEFDEPRAAIAISAPADVAIENLRKPKLDRRRSHGAGNLVLRITPEDRVELQMPEGNVLLQVYFQADRPRQVFFRLEAPVSIRILRLEILGNPRTDFAPPGVTADAGGL